MKGRVVSWIADTRDAVRMLKDNEVPLNDAQSTHELFAPLLSVSVFRKAKFAVDLGNRAGLFTYSIVTLLASLLVGGVLFPSLFNLVLSFFTHSTANIFAINVTSFFLVFFVFEAVLILLHFQLRKLPSIIKSQTEALLTHLGIWLQVERDIELIDEGDGELFYLASAMLFGDSITAAEDGPFTDLNSEQLYSFEKTGDTTYQLVVV